MPPITQLARALHERMPDVPSDVFTVEHLVSALRAQKAFVWRGATNVAPLQTNAHEPIITVEHLSHFYMLGTPLQVQALFDVNADVRRGEVLGIIGHTGSGKSTLVQHFNALLRPHEGSVRIFGQDANDPRLDAKAIRRRVGLLFQSPEAQLFEHYVGDDVAYGPRNLKLSREEVRARVRRAMESVGLGFEEFKDRITFGLSGGEMRRVALAGVLALEPEVLVLDEPTAGLDPQGRRQVMALIRSLRAQGLTLVIISHNMEELAQLCDRLVVVSEGRTVLSGTPREVFAHAQALREMGLGVPAITDAVAQITGQVVLTVDEAAQVLLAGGGAEMETPSHETEKA